MFETPLNAKNVTVKMRRIDLCDLIMACTEMSFLANAATHDQEHTKKWDELHDKLDAILKAFDEKQGF